MEQEIRYTRNLGDVNWAALKAALTADDFDNGRTPEQLHHSFANSDSVCFAWANGEIVGKAWVLSEGVCNAYLVDVWTQSAYRQRGIATHMLDLLLHDLPGQHVYLQSDADTVPFYQKCGFAAQPHGLSCIVGCWLDNAPKTE
jgi:predicted GNAT family acetyltransferase